MKNINKIIKYMLLLLPGLVFTAGCNEDEFLTRLPLTQPAVEGFFKNQKNAISSVNAAYAPLSRASFYSAQFHISYGAMGDDLSTTEIAYNRYTFQDNEDIIKNMWWLNYQGIMRANIVLENVPKMPDDIIDPNIRKRIIGEAYFLRALYYWHLVTIWGEVPLITKYEADFNNISGEKSNKEKIWAQIEADLKAAKEAELPAKYAGGDAGRVTSGAVQALLGKAYLYQKKYTEAANEFKAVIASEQYELLKDPQRIFHVRNENNPESIFEIQFRAQGGNQWHNEDNPTSSQGAMRPIFVAPQQYGGSWENVFPSKKLVDAMEIESLRKKAWLVSPNDIIVQTVNTSTGALNETRFDPSKNKIGPLGLKHGIKKGVIPAPDKETDVLGAARAPWANAGFDDNWIIIRYADLLLMYAEALANGGGNEDPAKYVNMVRKRAFGEDVYDESVYGVQKLMTDKGWTIMDAIKNERFIELAFEGHRFPDLVRWGDATTELNERTEASEFPFTEQYKYWPIPITEIDASKGQLKQNPLWE